MTTVSIFLFAEQHAITDNRVEVILKDDSTWVAVDSLEKTISPFAMIEDSQMVYLKDDGAWEYMKSDRADIDSIAENILLLDKHKPKFPDIEIIPYWKLEVKPKPLNAPIPKYPTEAQMSGIEGTVIVKMLIDIDGTVKEVQILKTSGNYMLDKAALIAAKKSIFSPAEHKGKKLRVWMSRPYIFKLQ
jgi:TonB family protein